MNKAQKLRELFNQDGVKRIVGAHDGLSAKLVEENGFDGVWASGFEISAAHAVPDANILTMTQYLDAASVMNDAISIPVIADCDTGYGNSNNVMYMVRKYEAAGIAAVAIEDKKFPKVNSYIPGRQELAPVAEFVGKILAAKNVQQTQDFMVIARVEALIAGWGLDEALCRAHAYVDAGADAILIHSKATTPDEIVSFARAWDFSAPLVVIPTTYPMLTLGDADKLGIKMMIYANQGLRASVKALNEVFSEIKQSGRLDTVADKIASMDSVFDLQGMLVMKEHEKIYLRSEEEPIKVIIPAAGAPHNQESLEPLLHDVALAMLDINGKSLLQRNVETLNKSRIYDINVITGYQSDSFNVKGVEYINNPEYNTKHILNSIMCAEDKIDGKTMIIFSDILFENTIIERLKPLEADFVIVIDNTFGSFLNRNKKLDLVVTREPLPNGGRTLTYNRLFNVEKLGWVSPEESNCAEFIGLTMLSKKGADIFKKEYHRALDEYQDKPFFEAPNIFRASLTDFLSYLIALGYEVKALPVNSGWMEIHTFDNYKYTCFLTKDL
jgi:phosphoenolpyruvate phosphomutase